VSGGRAAQTLPMLADGHANQATVGLMFG
jgi:hypothetical protein